MLEYNVCIAELSTYICANIRAVNNSNRDGKVKYKKGTRLKQMRGSYKVRVLLRSHLPYPSEFMCINIQLITFDIIDTSIAGVNSSGHIHGKNKGLISVGPLYELIHSSLI